MGVALYGLVCLYQLTKERIKDKRPLAKFLSIKLIVALTYYQAFIFAALSQRGIIKETSEPNHADTTVYTLTISPVISILVGQEYQSRLEQHDCLYRSKLAVSYKQCVHGTEQLTGPSR